MTIYNTYLDKYVSATNSTKTSHTDNKQNALIFSKHEALKTCELLNFTTRTDHYTIHA